MADDSAVLKLNGNLRIMTGDSPFILGSEGDKDVNTVTFSIPDTYRGVALKSFGTKKVLWENADGLAGETALTNEQEATDGVFTADWLVGQDVCVSDGTVKFSLCLQLTGDDGTTVSKDFNSTTATGKVLPSLHVAAVSDDDGDGDVIDGDPDSGTTDTSASE